MKKLELVAPAGNLLKLKTALAHGADAVYLGIPDFSLRVRINDFDFKSLKEAVSIARAKKKKVYVTVNIFAHNHHLRRLSPYIKKLKILGVDALIVSDPGVLTLIRRIWPTARIHLSTQANCTNAEAAKFWYSQGVKRIVLGREVSLGEIKEIHRALPKLELEYFAHGAMCMSYSGRCFLSKAYLDRSANLGDCAQPCRWEHNLEKHILKARGHKEEFELVEERHGTYILNSKDLCLIKHLPDLAAAGVSSFKIEGRAKSVYYQAVVVGAYHRALALLSGKMEAGKRKKELSRLFSELSSKLVHRGYTAGFLLGGRGEENIADSHEKCAWEFCGQVYAQSGRRVYFQVHNTIRSGDTVELVRPDYDIIKMRAGKIFDVSSGEELPEAHGGGGGRQVFIELSRPAIVPEFSVLRRKI